MDKQELNTRDTCPKCGSSDIQLNIERGQLCCLFCRHFFSPNRFEEADEIANIVYKGAEDIDTSDSKIITLRCEHCSAEVGFNLEDSSLARCHWCRNILSINNPVPSGAIPDAILPFGITREKAELAMQNFKSKRSFFAHPKFNLEFKKENIMGVYFPYFLFDVKTEGEAEGRGEILIASHRIKSGDKTKTVYDADEYNVLREFSLEVDDLAIEASANKADLYSKSQTNNILNSILPYDTENLEKYRSHFTKGYNIENRSLNKADVEEELNTQLKFIAKSNLKPSINQYDRGVFWESCNLSGTKTNIKAAFLPVWLYSYLDAKNIKHFIAVNGRTGELMGSIPLNLPKIIFFSFLIEILGAILCFYSYQALDSRYEYAAFSLLLSGFFYFSWIYTRYRNQNAFHNVEKETKAKLNIKKKEDRFIVRKFKLANKYIHRRNDEETRY